MKRKNRKNVLRKNGPETKKQRENDKKREQHEMTYRENEKRTWK